MTNFSVFGIINIKGKALKKGTVMLKKKWFLYLTEFFSGMSVMAIELGASRLLAPYFSSSQIVWTIIIGAIMSLVPGVAITNIMRDIIAGDVITGTTKLAEVLLIALAIAVGIALAMSTVIFFGGGL